MQNPLFANRMIFHGLTVVKFDRFRRLLVYIDMIFRQSTPGNEQRMRSAIFRRASCRNRIEQTLGATKALLHTDSKKGHDNLVTSQLRFPTANRHFLRWTERKGQLVIEGYCISGNRFVRPSRRRGKAARNNSRDLERSPSTVLRCLFTMRYALVWESKVWYPKFFCSASWPP